MGSQTVLGLFVLVKETFSSAPTFTVIDKFGKGGDIQIVTVF